MFVLNETFAKFHQTKFVYDDIINVSGAGIIWCGRGAKIHPVNTSFSFCTHSQIRYLFNILHSFPQILLYYGFSVHCGLLNKYRNTVCIQLVHGLYWIRMEGTRARGNVKECLLLLVPVEQRLLGTLKRSIYFNIKPVRLHKSICKPFRDWETKKRLLYQLLTLCLLKHQ